jgi:hypothetical protein
MSNDTGARQSKKIRIHLENIEFLKDTFPTIRTDDNIQLPGKRN